MKPEQKKMLSFRVPASLHRLLRIVAAEQEKTMEMVATEAIVEYLKR